MPIIRKQILKTGTYLIKCPNGNGGHEVRSVAFSRADINHFYRQGQAMIRAGLQIPVPMEHPPLDRDALPLSHAERLANTVTHNAGWVDGYERDANSLWGLVNVEDAELAAKLPKSIKYVSPEIVPEFVGAGRVWKNVIAHVALTCQPVQHDQIPFGEGASEAPTNPATVAAAGKALRWSQAAMAGPLRFSMADRLGGSAMAKDDEDFMDKSKDPADDAPDAEEIDAADAADGDAGQGDDAFLEQAKEIAAKLGIMLPEHTDATNFKEHFVVAGTALLHQEDGGGNPDDMGQQQGQQGGQAREEPQMMAMSYKDRAEKAEKALADARLTNVNNEVDELVRTKRVTVAQANGWKTKLGAKRLSLATGQDADAAKIMAQIEFAKGLPANIYGPSGRKVVRLSKTADGAVEEEIEPNAQWHDDDDPEERSKMIERLSGSRNGKK